MRSLFIIIGKDLRLMLRDRPALLFIVIAPVIVIAVAGLSLSGLYGAGPLGRGDYVLPIADEDGGSLGHQIEAKVRDHADVVVLRVGSREEAERLVREKAAGSALVIPEGTTAAIAAGQAGRLLLYTDPVKYLERLNVRIGVLETRDALVREERARNLERLREQDERLREEIAEFFATVERLRGEAAALDETLASSRTEVAAEIEAESLKLQESLDRQIGERIDSARDTVNATVAARFSAISEPALAYLDALTEARESFASWFEELQRLANRRADDIPAPPEFPEPPPALVDALSEPLPTIVIPIDVGIGVALPAPDLPVIGLDALDIDFPRIDLPDLGTAPGELVIEERTVDGSPTTVNTFDQNVPGFSITFLLLGMLLGISLGILDERDWGTFDRVRSLPVPARNILIGKLGARFGVGVLQMIVLFAVGYFVFDISLGPDPWALLLPITGIAFAGTAFGLIVAAVARSRDAVLPLGSIAIVTMAAVGGCWWPIDLEPSWMRTTALAFPTAWAMDAFNDLMIRGRPGDSAYVPTAVLFLYGFIYLGIGLFLFRRQIARS